LSPADYTYDAQGRVTAMTPGSGSTNTYSEDASGNLTALPDGSSTAYDYGSELTSSTLSGTTTDFTYDAAGNRTQAAVGGSTTVSATYDGANQVATYENSSANMTAATYDGDGIRTSDTATPTGGTSSTEDFVWDKTTSVPRLLMDSENAYVYADSRTPIEQVSLASGTIQYLVSDALGSVRGVVSATGSLAASASYDAWGNLESSGLTTSTPFGFAGGYTDETGLLYLINRYYDPATGQFVSVDPLVYATQQPYGYVGDNPLEFVDPLGLYPGEGFVHEAEHLANVATNTVAKVEAVVPYAAYYVIYRTQSSIGSNLPGPVNSAITSLDNSFLTIDQWLDSIKRATGSAESNNDENVNAGILPFNVSGLDKRPCDPLYTYLPGVHANGDRDLYPNHSYPWSAGWGPIPLGP
jgi:RHS repeat-associated protein